ncbi:MAG: SpoIIE family protein phosphatase, partial [Acidobacteriales bacterium]|nr:SpoIIE family protein phosphatase [Terriglobales bacterium]
ISPTQNPRIETVISGTPGQKGERTVERNGVATPLMLTLTLAPARRVDVNPITTQLLTSYPVLFLLVGLPVLFLRVDSRHAWLLAIMLAGFISAAPLIPLEGVIDPALRGFALAYMTLFYGTSPFLFYFFFATFPVSSPLDRRLPWLKWVLVGISAIVVVPLALWMFWDGSSYPLWLVAGKLPGSWSGAAIAFCAYGAFILGFVSLIWNTLTAPTPEARRKTRVMVWGMLAGVGPFILFSVIAIAMNRDMYAFPFWLWASTVLATFLVPLSIAYAVVKHRVLEIPALFRRGARYLLVQRGFIFLMVVIAAIATVWLARYASGRLAQQAELAVGLGVLFGVGLVWGGTEVHTRVRQRIDRAFFRSSYDARQILEDLAVKTRDATSRNELAQLLERHLREALVPTSLYVYLDVGDGLQAHSAGLPRPLQQISSNLPLLAELSRRGEPVEIPPDDSVNDSEQWNGPGRFTFVSQLSSRMVWTSALGQLAELRPEVLVPITDREARPRGLLLLGQRRSEEPYSREDMRLLGSVASQTAVALLNIGLAEKIAERLEAERIAARELEIAQEVQQKLLPQKVPVLETLEYAAKCVQARAVGGDYYDFLDLAPGALGFVLADIAGKGISAALLMANLQANLRSQYALALSDLPKLLLSVNRVFYESTEPSKYATLFWGTYTDESRCLRYANCGHNPPIVLRGNEVRRLASTSTVLGLFAEWECNVDEIALQPGDLLVVFSDGVSEATNRSGEEFGEARLIKLLQAHRALPVGSLLEEIVTQVQEFSSHTPSDDVTLFVARVQ